jgi:cytochrome c-type biogenesis protein CcmH/NrfG
LGSLLSNNFFPLFLSEKREKRYVIITNPPWSYINMTKDNLVFGLAGVILGIILGVLIVNFSTRPGASPQFASQGQPAAPPQGQPATQGQLPEGHPPVNTEALQREIAEKQEILKKDPENREAVVEMGNLNFDLKNYEEASKWYSKALEKDPKNINLITDMGSCYLWLKQPEKAIEYYNRSLAMDPNHFQTLMNIGIARMSMGNRAGAAEAWEKIVKLYPDNPETPMLRDAVKKLRENPQGSM